MRAAGRRPVLISAHRCNDRGAIERALALGVDYVEIDLVREGEAVAVAHDHGAAATIGFAEVLELLRPGGRLHLDLKFASPGHRLEEQAVADALAALGADRLVVTTGRGAVLRHLRDRYAGAGAGAGAGARSGAGAALRLGLSLGGDVAGRPWREQWRVRRSELFPAERLAAAGADTVVGHWALALLTLRRYSRRHGAPLLVWTVNDDRLLRLLLRPGRSQPWMLTTDRPEAALTLRERAGAGRLRA